MHYCDLLDIYPSNPSFAQKNLANATFLISLAFQMREEMSLEKEKFFAFWTSVTHSKPVTEN